MSGKAKRGQGKHSSQNKKRKGRQPSAVIVAQQKADAPVLEPAVPTEPSSPAVSAPAPTAKPVSVRYPDIGIELRNIGILAGIMVVILVVLALALP
ncbi:hypothetical protein ACFLV3_05590 [Chloroflexota bacterium]